MEFLAALWLDTAIPLPQVCTTTEIGLFSISCIYYWWSLWKKTLKEGIHTHNFCRLQRFRWSHLPVLDIHQIVSSSSFTFLIGVQLFFYLKWGHAPSFSLPVINQYYGSCLLCSLNTILGSLKCMYLILVTLSMGMLCWLPTFWTGGEYHELLRIKWNDKNKYTYKSGPVKSALHIWSHLLSW